MSLKGRILRALGEAPDHLELLETLCHVQLQLVVAQIAVGNTGLDASGSGEAIGLSSADKVSVKGEIRRAIDGLATDLADPREALYQIYRDVMRDRDESLDRGLTEEEIHQLVARWFEVGDEDRQEVAR